MYVGAGKGVDVGKWREVLNSSGGCASIGANSITYNMASHIPPPEPGNPVPKEYVRQQLNSLGIKDVTEEDLESYAKGKLLKGGHSF